MSIENCLSPPPGGDAPRTALVDRLPDETLFLTPEGPVTSAAFLGQAAALAETLPPCRFLALPSRDRLTVAVGFAAAQLRGITALMTADRSHHALNRLMESYPDAVLIFSPGEDERSEAARQGWPVHPWTWSRHTAEWRAELPRIPDEHLAAIAFTSGSTGTPVAHPKRWRALADRSRAIGRRLGLPETGGPAGAPPRQTASIVAPIPSQHMYGFELSLLLPLHASAAVWCGTAFYPADIAAALHHVPAPRILVFTPLQMRALQDANLPAPALSKAISATAPLQRDLAAGFEARHGTEVWEIYGATEIGSFATRRTVAEDTWHLLDGVSLSAASNGGMPRDDTPPVSETDAPGNSVEIEQPVASAPYCPDMPLADIVALLPGRSFRLIGRQADIIKRGGKRASLAGLSRILSDLPGVTDGAFYLPGDGMEDADTPGGKLIALVVAPHCPAAAILEELRARIDPAFLPRRIVHVDALPRNVLGKLPRRAVEELLHRMAIISSHKTPDEQ